MSRDLECFVVVESGSLRLQNTASDNISPMVSVFGEALKGFNCLARLIIVQELSQGSLIRKSWAWVAMQQ